jgi:L,D-transpeptidase YnhG
VLITGLLALLPVGAQAKKPVRDKHPHVKAAKHIKKAHAKKGVRQAAPIALAPPLDGEAEARLIDIYQLIGQARGREALSRAESLVHDHPNFQLAQLVYGDLLNSRARPVLKLGDVPDADAKASAPLLAALREESQMRLKALRERPQAGTLPSQFTGLSASNRHAIAVDASRSRLYLFENTATGLSLVADYYISLGKLGIEKTLEGDQRTPLGIYYITSNLDPKTLKDFYGSGALPINYPNPLDVSRGKTGGGIWLHGTPPSQFSRAPRASDGCLVLSNPDLERLLKTVEVRTTPVVIAQHLNWVAPQSAAPENRAFESALSAWQQAKTGGNLERVRGFYAPHFKSFDKTVDQWNLTLRDEVSRVQGRKIELKEVSYLRWIDTADTMVVTFGEVIQGMRSGPVKRQYWVRQDQQWKIFFEGVIG